MAKSVMYKSFSNVMIDSADLDNGNLTFQEIDKDETRFYDLVEVLRDFCDKEGVSITIKHGVDIPGYKDD